MSELKCPFCQQELKPQTIDGGWLECWNCSYREPNSNHLPQPILCGSRELWQELIRARKALETAVSGLEKMTWGCDSSDAEHLLKEITALDQKDE